MPRTDGSGPQIRFTHCDSCGVKLVTQRAWNAETKQGRKEMKADGYARQGVGAHCSRCSK